jgi:hypothetical protein
MPPKAMRRRGALWLTCASEACAKAAAAAFFRNVRGFKSGSPVMPETTVYRSQSPGRSDVSQKTGQYMTTEL